MNPIVEQEPYKSFLAPKTQETKITYAQNLSFIRRSIGKEIYLATANELKQFFLDCIARGVGKPGLQGYKAALSSFFNHLLADEESKFHRVDDPTRLLKKEIDTRNKDKTLRKALTPAQREKVYECLIWDGDQCTIYEYQKSLAIILGFQVGLRRFEIAKAEWKDFDLTEGTLTVLGKGAKKVTVPLAKAVIERIKGYEDLCRASGIDSRWIFFKCPRGERSHKTDTSKHWLKWTIGEWFKAIGKRAGLGEDVLFSSHDGRRCFCTVLHEKNVKDLNAIQLTRHESVDMFKRYVRIDEAKLKSEINRALE